MKKRAGKLVVVDVTEMQKSVCGQDHTVDLRECRIARRTERLRDGIGIESGRCIARTQTPTVHSGYARRRPSDVRCILEIVEEQIILYESRCARRDVRIET